MRFDSFEPVIKASQRLPELTLKVILLGVILALVLAVSSTYLALKIGVLTASSIPAAILSMGILRFTKGANILEHNLVQTCASAGEAIAGGIVYTTPALIIIHYWLRFSYGQTFLIALVGGALGVMFTIPLRRVFVRDPDLRFPEAQAIAEVLKTNVVESARLKYMFIGSGIGAGIELLQNGFKLLANQVSIWLAAGNAIFNVGLGFSATLIGAGYLMGFGIGLSIIVGAVIAHLFCLPVLSVHYQSLIQQTASVAGNALTNDQIRYIGIGAMLLAGFWTLLSLLKPLKDSLQLAISFVFKPASRPQELQLRTEQDIPFNYILLSLLVLMLMAFFLFYNLFDFQIFNIHGMQDVLLLVVSLLYVLVIGFIFAAICGYFSGLVGVAASPGSAIAIASVLIAGLVISSTLYHHDLVNQTILLQAQAITIILAAVVMGSAAVANNNSQDLKVGQLVGATPWKQQLMLLIGGVVAALIIPLVMQLLYSVYGIANVVPRAGMSLGETLPAPPAAAMAAIAQGLFQHQLPWNMLLIGGLIIIVIAVLQQLFWPRYKLSLIGIAIGIYLPLSSTTPLFLGALLSYLVQSKIKIMPDAQQKQANYRGIVLACGMVAGAAVTNVILAIPFALFGNADLLNVLPTQWHGFASTFACIVTAIILIYFYRTITRSAR